MVRRNKEPTKQKLESLAKQNLTKLGMQTRKKLIFNPNNLKTNTFIKTAGIAYTNCTLTQHKHDNNDFTTSIHTHTQSSKLYHFTISINPKIDKQINQSKIKKMVDDLKDAIAIASVTKVLKPKVPFSFWKMISKGLLELRTCSAHQTLNHDVPQLLNLSSFQDYHNQINQLINQKTLIRIII